MADQPNDVTDPSLLSAAYQERDRQLHAARAALAEVVSELTAELRELRAQAAALRVDNEALRKEVERLGQTVGAFQNMKVVRWSAPLRGFIYRLRG